MTDMVSSESTWEKMKRDAKLGRKARAEGFQKAEKEGWGALKQGKAKEGVLGLGGTYAPLLQSAVLGAATYALMTSEWFGQMEVFKKNWYLKGVAMLLVGYLLYRQGHQVWGQALVSVGALILVKDWKDRPKTKADGTAEGVDEEAGYYDWNRGRGDWREEREHEARRLAEGRWERGADRLADVVFEREHRRE